MLFAGRVVIELAGSTLTFDRLAYGAYSCFASPAILIETGADISVRFW